MTSASSGRAPAVLFDIDGTLVDSNYLHVHAWQRAFHDVGVGVDAWRIHRCIGMDGSALITTLGGDQLDDTTSAELKKRHSDYYARTAALLRLLPGARALLHHVEQMGLQVVLATSAPQDELALLRTVLPLASKRPRVTPPDQADSSETSSKGEIVRATMSPTGAGAPVGKVRAAIARRACMRVQVIEVGGGARRDVNLAGARATGERRAEVRAGLANSAERPP